MDSLAALPTPVTPVAPLADAQNARDQRSGDAADAGGFDQALKQELAMRGPDGEKPLDKDSGAAEAEAEAASVSGDAPAAVDPAAAAEAAIAALMCDPIPQPVVGAIAPHALPEPVMDAAKNTGSDTEADATITAAAGSGEPRPFDRSVGERGTAGRRNIDRGPGVVGERAALERAATERATIDRGVTDRGVLDRAATERTAVERGGTDRGAREPGELREATAKRGANDLPGAGRDKAAADTPTAAFLAALGAERNAAAEGAAPATATVAALDSLTAANLTAKWAATAMPGIGEPAPAPVTARIDTPLGTNGWGDAFQQKIVWLVDRQLGNAELHVNPPHLGPIEVMLNLSDEGTRIAFCSPHAAVREAIEANLPDLRSALDERGLSLGQTSVSADSSAAREQFSNHARENARQASGRPATGPVIAEPPMASTLRVQRGIVDLFA